MVPAGHSFYAYNETVLEKLCILKNSVAYLAHSQATWRRLASYLAAPSCAIDDHLEIALGICEVVDWFWRRFDLFCECDDILQNQHEQHEQWAKHLRLQSTRPRAGPGTTVLIYHPAGLAFGEKRLR
jgi:hypothetical protein